MMDSPIRIPDFATFNSMPPEQTFELIELGTLLERVRALSEAGWRLVQIGAATISDQIEIIYSFDLKGGLTSLKVSLPAAEARVPSISSIYWCAFLYENEMHDLFNVQVEGMAVDFHGHFYRTAVKFPFASVKPPVTPQTNGSGAEKTTPV
jgi:ech hydrogenase subunit D